MKRKQFNKYKKMDIDELEYKIANNEMTPAQVFTQMLPHINWYKKRCELLQEHQKTMRDPERTLVCDIIANGQLLNEPKRYSL